MLGEGLLSKEVIFKGFRNRCKHKRARGERLRGDVKSTVERKQGEEESTSSFADRILRLGLDLKEDVDDWQSLMVDTFKSTLLKIRIQRVPFLGCK